ncbi:hypothetical protein ACFVIN_30975, partial [Streptomyces prasinus]|uniref:hypothetical protein n=1 Tax=Streptomyces prasinus TaxID=67345 RepID=UPI00362ABDCE
MGTPDETPGGHQEREGARSEEPSPGGTVTVAETDEPAPAHEALRPETDDPAPARAGLGPPF